MNTNKLRNIENLIILTFPLVLFAGCAGNDVLPVNEDQGQHQIINQSSNDGPPAEILTSENLPVNPVESIDTDPVLLTENNSPEIEIKAEKKLNIKPVKKVFFFDTDKFLLSDEQRDELKVHAKYLMENPGSVLVIKGHADIRGTERYNQTLSEKRAGQTYQYLLEQGVAQNQLFSEGFGEQLPLNSRDNWDENRRVELEYTDSIALTTM